MDRKLKEKILKANITEHAKEAAIYDLVHPEIFSKQAQHRIVEILDEAEKKIMSRDRKALDIGAGTGNITLKLLKKNINVDAVDISMEMLEILKGKLTEKEKKQISIVVADADGFLNNKNEEYDLIVTSSLLHHLPEYTQTLKLMEKALKPGGVLVNLHEPSGQVVPGIFGKLTEVDAVVHGLFFL